MLLAIEAQPPTQPSWCASSSTDPDIDGQHPLRCGRSSAPRERVLAAHSTPGANEDVRSLTSIGIGGPLAVPPLPHHRAYGSRTRRFDWVKLGQDHVMVPSKPGFRVLASPRLVRPLVSADRVSPWCTGSKA